jgi:hypothetical protein
MRRNFVSQHTSASVALTHFRCAQTSIALGARGATRLPFPAGSFIEGFRSGAQRYSTSRFLPSIQPFSRKPLSHAA